MPMNQTTGEKSSQTLLKYKPPPYLKGYTYNGSRAYAARDTNKLRAMRIETNHTCNLKCRYCYAESENGLREVIEFDTLKCIIRQAHDLGAESIVISGGGSLRCHTLRIKRE